MRFGSVCSGIEAASVAWLPLRWQCQFMSEIEAFPRAVLQHHYGDVPLHGDFTTIRAGEYGPIDVLVGGTPCQSFSIAGLRGGMEDARGNLALEYLRLADRLRPRWLVWENVPGVRSSNGGRDFGAFLGGLGQLGYGWAYRSLDAQHFGLAQRRERVFVVGHLGDWRRAAAVLFEPASMRGDSAPGRETGEGIAGTIAASLGGCDENDAADGRLIAAVNTGHGYWNQSDVAAVVCGHGANSKGAMPDATLVAYGGNNTAGPIDVATAVNAHGGPHGRLDFESETFVAYRTSPNRGAWDTGARIDALTTGTDRTSHLIGFQSSQSGVRSVNTHATLDANNGSRRHNGAVVGSGVRRLTPRECERLQGFPDDYTAIPFRSKPAADGPRYKALGNSMAVPVMSWIGHRIAEVT